MRKANHYSACYAIIKNEKGEILFMQRANTGFRDGGYQLPAGHIESGETMKECMIKEAKEEVCIDIKEEDLEVKHISHRISEQEDGSLREYFDVYLEIKKYSGELSIGEPHKCSDLKFIDINNIKNPELFSYDIDILKMIDKGIYFSEI